MLAFFDGVSVLNVDCKTHFQHVFQFMAVLNKNQFVAIRINEALGQQQIEYLSHNFS